MAIENEDERRKPGGDWFEEGKVERPLNRDKWRDEVRAIAEEMGGFCHLC